MEVAAERAGGSRDRWRQVRLEFKV